MDMAGDGGGGLGTSMLWVGGASWGVPGATHSLSKKSSRPFSISTNEGRS